MKMSMKVLMQMSKHDRLIALKMVVKYGMRLVEVSE